MSERTCRTTAPQVTNTVQHLWSVSCRSVVSVLLLLHLSAVVIAPCTKPPPRSELAYRLSSWVEPYLSAMYLFHGYRFFCPNPGPGHLVRCEVYTKDGSQLIHEGTFPDRDVQWPRLHYHRYFMIAERLWAEATPLPPPPRGFESRQQQESYEQYLLVERQELETFASAIARYQQRLHKGGLVRIYVQEHVIPPPQVVADGLRLDARELYQERFLGEISNAGQWTSAEKHDESSHFRLP